MSSAATDRTQGQAGRGAVDELALFHRTLAQLCRSDVPLSKAFRVLEADLERGRLRDAVRAMADEVDAGTPIHEAYASHQVVFPPTYRALVEAGTASGDLPGTLEEVAAHAARQAETQDRIRRALAWPMLSAFAILLVAAGALAFAVPKLWSFSETVGGSSPAGIAYGALGALFLIFAILASVAWRRRPAEGSWSFAVPVLGPIRRDGMRARVASTLALLLRRRLPLGPALELAAATAGEDLAEARLREAAEHVQDGDGLADVLERADVFDPSVVWFLKGAEGAGEAEDALEDAAEVYRRRLDRRLDRFTLLVRPAAELVLGAVVFCFAFSYLVPLFQYTSRVIGGPY